MAELVFRGTEMDAAAAQQRGVGFQGQLRAAPSSWKTGSERLESKDLPLPLSLYLSPAIPPASAAALRDLAHRRPQVARVVDAEEGALHVLHNFVLEEVAALEKRRCRIIGLPFAERILRDPGALGKVPALPLFDSIYRREGAVCCSGFQQAQRLRYVSLARWMGARFSEDLETEKVGLLVASRVSLHPESKYQAALKKRIPIVKPSYLESMWKATEEVDLEPHIMPTFFGLSLCFDPRQGDVIEQFKDKAMSLGALIEPLDRAEVVIVKDTFSKLYQEARKIGILAAPPLWLERCLQLRCCLPITGELEVLNPKSLSLVLYGGPSAAPGGAKLAPVAEGECGVGLLDCVICLLYLQPGHQRDAAKYLAWRCGAFTTLNPTDKAITHVMFKAVAKTQVQVSVPIDEDRVSFVDMSWLEACAQEGHRAREVAFPQQRVVYNPTCDEAYARVLRRTPGTGTTAQPTDWSSRAAAAGSGLPATGAEQAAPSLPPPQPQLPAADAGGAEAPAQAPPPAAMPPRVPALRPAARLRPTAQGGVFANMVLGFVGWATGDSDPELLKLLETVRGQGGTVVHGGSPPEAVLEGQLDACICRNFGPPPFTNPRLPAPLATVLWVNACVADGTCHDRSSFPHFEPGPGLLPLPEMAGCSIRITALEASSHRKRLRLEELALALGAQVAQQASRWSMITHVVCAVPELLDRKLLEGAARRNVPVVTVQWLFDCFRTHSRQAEERYSVSSFLGKAGPQASQGGPSAASFAATVLAGHEVLISPSALGSNAQLPQMGEELGATVHTWRSVDELKALLEARGGQRLSTSGPGGAAGDAGGGAGRPQAIVLVDAEEVREVGAPLTALVTALGPERRSIFALPTWLSETYQQRRRLPLEAFAALPPEETEGREAKRQRLDEATYAWQPAEATRLEEMAEDSRARELQSKVQQKVNEGLRLAELRKCPRP
mmetsp:Transcript_13061/g.37230  ORF Transcript_13061/g.37230 Transcript_13061/m.37230 type:complete len:952 (+) Transcript_13061:87-2942(+)